MTAADGSSGIDTVLVFEGQGAREVPGDPPLDLTAVSPAVAQVAIVRHQVDRARAFVAAGDAGSVAVLGQSLGELSALVIAGALDLDDALELARLRAELPGALVASRNWTMVSLTRVDLANARHAAAGLELWIVGENGPADSIIVGEADAWATFAGRLALKPATYRQLPVTYPYHTPLMQPVADEVATIVARLDVRAPFVPMRSPTGPRVVDGVDGARAVITDALVAPVAWSTALTAAARDWPGARWRECGPSASLHRFVWKNGLALDWADA